VYQRGDSSPRERVRLERIGFIAAPGCEAPLACLGGYKTKQAGIFVFPIVTYNEGNMVFDPVIRKE
jgi:hypothetical protein